MTTPTDFSPFGAAVRAERLRTRTLRSLRLVLALVPLLTAAVAFLPAGSGGGDGLHDAFFGVMFGQLTALAFGTLVVTGQLAGDGGAHVLLAVPRRGRAYAARTLTTGTHLFLAGLLAGILTSVCARLATGDAAVGPGNATAWRAVTGCALYLTLVGLLASGVATWLRHGVATLSLTLAVLFVLPFVVGDSAGGAARFLPATAGQLVLRAHPSDGPLGPWTGLGVLALWTLLALGAGWRRLSGRDV
ncbi:ABC transporter permease [Streptomyces sp. AM 3-1-1]|uniref:ABC transporter permease n=1 Tax=Streptomyces sp. AM 3-1-1 TaxID=3028711 RepID=UPI0023B8B5E1|nr:ABC transporter permease [Streptomyces sp. AM 3-1-1]WEH26225.1 ABC transporter permease [Streptomyces sp. AM 3-1-1]